MSDNSSLNNGETVRRTVETAIKLALLFLLLYWCYTIIRPFMDILLWSVIFAVALFPLYNWLKLKLGNKKALSAGIIVVVMLFVLAIPGVLFAKSLYEGVTFLKTQYETAGSIIPEAPEQVASWPLLGPFLYEKWNWISQHLGEALKEYAPQIKLVLVRLFSSVASAGAAFLKLILSIIVAGFLLISSEKAGKLALEVFNKLIGEKGAEFAAMTEKTIRTVIKGILGVAFIQSFLFGIGMVVAGVPAAGLWVILSLIFGIIQIGIFPVSIPVIIYVFATKSTGIAIFFLVWSIVVSPIDNILKPILLGQGAVVPMPVIFVGAIGGFIASGLVGLFTGAIVFSVGYKLFLFWLEEKKQEVV
ncbi:MAG: AI-2E family transporter [Bacteroidales bacterium]|nr:AI-2E family transporter [Bacteroidales bacterium]